jgi:hypothetical protein
MAYAKLIQVDILYNNNEIMVTAYGNTSKQASRNASIEGIKWLRGNKVNGQIMD